jgi:hypothetical protein
MGYIINKVDSPCTSHAKGKPTSSIYNKKVLTKESISQKIIQITQELSYKEAGVSTSHDNYS